MSLARLLSAAPFLLVLACTEATAAPTAEIFVDKGDTFVRAGTKHGFDRGEELTIVGPPAADGTYTRVGTGTVLEAWPSMARISLDKAASAAGPDVAVLLDPKALAKPAEAKGDAEGEPAKVEPPKLKGGVKIVGVGPLKQVRVTNASGSRWTKCELRLPNNKRFILDKLDANETHGVALPRFVQDGVARDVPLTSVTMSCNEGRGTFRAE